MSRQKKSLTELPRGKALLHDAGLNKGTAFTAAERDALGLQGLLPARVFTQAQHVQLLLDTLRRRPDNFERYLYLTGVCDSNEKLFYRALIDHIEELAPIVYTPTVGQACQEYSRIFRRPRGLFLTKHDRGRIREVLRNWPAKEVRVIVVTDGERILGLGDLGANGMGIPVGKLSLYIACAGIDPDACLPITIDVGTNKEEVLADPAYMGLAEPRLRGEEYEALIDEFMEAASEVFPHVLIQHEDFGNANAFHLLKKYRDRYCMFNDDIQGTASVALAGLYSALRMIGGKLAEQRLLFLGAGEANIGIGNLVVSDLVKAGLSEAEALSRCWFVDSKGLVVRSRTGLSEEKRRFAQDAPPQQELLAAITAIRPTALIGASGQPHTFTKEILETMAKINERPIIFALSNPTSKSECTAEEAYRFTGQRAVFASGSPFAPVEIDGRTFVPAQSNNSYIFPGVGLGIVVSQASRVTDEMFAVAAETLAAQGTEADFAMGRIFPPLANIREVSAKIAYAVAKVVFARGLTTMQEPADLAGTIATQMYDPVYPQYV